MPAPDAVFVFFKISYIIAGVLKAAGWSAAIGEMTLRCKEAVTAGIG